MREKLFVHLGTKEMNIFELYELRNVVTEVPHLIVNLNQLYSGTKQLIILVNLCVKYRVRILESENFQVRSDFKIEFFQLECDTERIPFASDLRKIILHPYVRGFWNFMLRHTAACDAEIFVLQNNFKDSISLASGCMESLYEKWIRSNYYIRNISFFDVEGKINLEEKYDVERILERNRNIFRKKRETTIILSGISRFRKLPKSLCRDVMNLITLFVWNTSPLDVYLADKKMNPQNSITF